MYSLWHAIFWLDLSLFGSGIYLEDNFVFCLNFFDIFEIFHYQKVQKCVGFPSWFFQYFLVNLGILNIQSDLIPQYRRSSGNGPSKYDLDSGD